MLELISMLLTAVVFLLLLSVLVLIHEAGHYFVAKKFGIKVEEFGFGFPPRMWGKKIGETIYSINWFPIGGFVKLYGEDEAGSGKIDLTQKPIRPIRQAQGLRHAEDSDRAFYSRSVWQRAAVVLAGVVMNTLLAIFIYYIFMFLSNFHTELPLLGQHQFFGVNQTVTTEVIVSAVEKNSPAEKAGLTAYSKIVSVNGEKITTSKRFLAVIGMNKGKPVALQWQDVKTNAISSATVTPRINPPKGQGALGVAFYPVDSVVLSYDTPTQKLFSGIVHPANLMVYNFTALKYLIDVSVKEKNVSAISEGVSGPIGIGMVVGTVINIPDIHERTLQLLNLMGLLSISLAFFNVLPIPGLDGGRLFFILIEAVTGRKVNEKFEGYAHAIGMIFLLALILLITVKDISQIDFMHIDFSHILR